MKQIEKLLKEYKIRFNVTDRILEVNYPFDKLNVLNKNAFYNEITENVIYNENGKVYENGVWATADIKELPKKWVVEKDETSPLWEQFEKWSRFPLTLPEKNDKYFSISADKKSITRNEELIFFEEHQYLTLEQWDEFCLPKVDFSILNDKDWFYAEDNVGTPALMNEIIENINILKPKYIYFIEKSELRKVEYYMSKSKISIFRKATEEDLKPLFEKHPELAPPKVGDSGLYFDNAKDKIFELKNGSVSIGKITDINNSTCTPYKIDDIFYWNCFYKIDMEKPLRPQINEFIEMYKNRKS